jgi:hypothetical protein
MHLSAALEDGFPDFFDDSRQAVCSYVGMGVVQDSGTGAVLAEDVQYFFYGTPLFASGVQFPVRISPGASFAEAVVGFGVDLLFAGDEGDVFFAFANVPSPFYDDGFSAQFYQAKGSEESCRPGANDYDGRSVGYVFVFDVSVCLTVRLFVDEYAHLQVDINCSLSRINGTFDDSDGLNIFGRESFFPHDYLPDGLPGSGFLWMESVLKFFNHACV